MRKWNGIAAAAMVVCMLAAGRAFGAAEPKSETSSVSSISQYGITWRFDKAYTAGRYCTGDWWVAGPVKVVAITTDLHAEGFTPTAETDGSMVNPAATGRQGYDGRLQSYDAALNAARPGGKPLSAANPLHLPAETSLVSMVSWLYRSKTDAEPGCPRFNGGTKTPRPVVRSAAVLTCVKTPPPAGSFRPPYCGQDKTARFAQADLKLDLLKKLPPVKATPSPEKLARAMARPWIDHVHEYLGAYLHPSENMPQYGQRMGQTMIQAALLLHVDFAQLPGKPSKLPLCRGLVQYGIDLAGVADVGGGWPANGGHGLGRKLPILFAGLMLGDEHMAGVGKWKTRFQEDEQTFYVSATDVERSHSAAWKPDKRSPLAPYESMHIGLPEWGIRHAAKPQADNRSWKAVYRSINGSVIPGFALAALIMDQKAAWGHDALFDYADRWMARTGGRHGHARLPGFATAMWKAYRARFGPVWAGRPELEAE